MQNGDGPPATSGNERKIIFLIGILAAVHVFIFSAAFPFFNNVDEPSHFDLVLKYAHGKIPRGAENFSAGSSAFLVLFMASDYFLGPEDFEDRKMPAPLWTETSTNIQQALAVNGAIWRSRGNYEISQPPLYYALAGAWWDAGQWLGLTDGHLLYWLRFLNIAEIVAIVYLGYVAARLIFPENRFIRLGVPLVLAFMPQTAFYAISNDPLSALCFGAVFIGVVRWLQPQAPSPRLGAFTGLAFAATYLAKITNFPLLIVISTVLVIATVERIRNGQRIWPALLAFLVCAGPPIIGWMMWCKLHFGDLTGAKLNRDHFGLTIKPFAQWWQHPIFSPHGVWTYLSGQLATFWQGEFSWDDHPLILPGSTALYTVLSVALLASALTGLFSRNKRDSAQCRALGLALICCTVILGFFAFLSVIYNFDHCPNPSREYPYFHQGRLMLGALIPFLLLIVYGLDRWLNRFKNQTKFLILGLMVLMMLGSEIATDWAVFSSPFNWFHLP